MRKHISHIHSLLLYEYKWWWWLSCDSFSFPSRTISTKPTAHRQEFEKRRKAHYKEFEAVQMARKLIEEEDEDEGDDDEDDLDSSKIIVVETTDVVLPPELPGSSSMDASPTVEDEEAKLDAAEGRPSYV